MSNILRSTCLFCGFFWTSILAAANPPRPIQTSDVKLWEQPGSITLSRDGKWFAYVKRPNEGDFTLTIKQTRGKKSYTIPAGRASGGFAYSRDSKYIAYRVTPPKSPKPSFKVVLLELDKGKKVEFAGASGFAFSRDSADWIAVQLSAPPTRPKGSAGWAGTDLVLRELATGKQLTQGNVARYSFNKSGRWLAMTIDSSGKAANGLQLMDMKTQRIISLDNAQVKYKNLNWTKKGDALTVLKESSNPSYTKPLHTILAFRRFEQGKPQRVVIDPAKDRGIPNDMTISPNRTPSWTRALDGILFGIHAAGKKEKKEPPKKPGKTAKPPSKSGSSANADLVLWHWRDKRLQSRQQVEASRDQRFSFLCIRRIGKKDSLRVADEEMRVATAANHHRYAVAFDRRKYELMGNLNGRRYQDIYTVDLQTGKRKLALKKIRFYMGASAEGNRILFFRKGHYHVYDIASGKVTNITRNAPVSFVNEEDDHNIKQPPIRPIGWCKGGKYVLLYDNWDIWRVPVKAGKPVNLTKDGRKNGIRYRTRYRLDPDEEGIDLAKPILIGALGEWTKQSGFVQIDGLKGTARRLVWGKAMYSRLRKARDHDTYVYTRETHNQYPNYRVSGKDLRSAKSLTNFNPQQKDFLWSSGVRLIDYKVRGKRHQAALFLPAKYIEGKSYPTVVYIYEKLSSRLNRYDTPRIGGFSKSIYTSQGYAVLMPDITYEVNNPGGASVPCVLGALDAAIKTSVVDPQRVGLHGHSWGGYQTSYIVTQTKRFKAAVAGAPLTNLISMYSSIYWNSGRPNQPIFESSQGRFTAGYWKNLKAYAENSPVYHAARVTTPLIILHNDKDGAVDWNQGIEYFNTLRRLRKRVVMLQYRGENHGLRKPANQKDYSRRMLEFFNHYLKGQPAPKWWQQGIKHLEMKKHVRQFRQSKDAKKQ